MLRSIFRLSNWPFFVIGLALAGQLIVPWVANAFGGTSQTFPPPVTGVRVYDPAGAISASQEAQLESRIHAIEDRSGAQIAIYVRVAPDVDNDSNLADARRLIDEWGVGRRGFDDGFVILLSFLDSTFQHGSVSTYAGSGFKAAYLNEDAQTPIREQAIIPAIRANDPGQGLIEAVDDIDAAITADATRRLETYRTLNALVGLPGSVLVLLLTLGFSYAAWRRHGDDPELSDSPSVLMAGPPAGMTPPLATVLRRGHAAQDAINTTLVELAGTGYISFRNLDQVRKVKSDDDADPLVDPAIDVLPLPSDRKALPPPEAEAYELIRQSAGSDNVVTRRSLWNLNDKLGPLKERLEEESVRLGWLTQRPSPMITRWTVIGVVELIAGSGLIWLGYIIPMSGITLLGAAMGVGGMVTIGFGRAMSQRTQNGAYVDSMLKAYRRTLEKTLQQARDMKQVIENDEVRVLADTPDKAVVWGIALGLHREVAAVLERSMADLREGTTTSGYYPVWLGSSSGSSLSGGSMGSADSGGLSGLFSGSGTPDIGGMFSSLGSMGSSPPSSSSGSGGGFGGGGGGGGGGGSSGF
jgi:uncharacterized membrane protein YgcG